MIPYHIINQMCTNKFCCLKWSSCYLQF